MHCHRLWVITAALPFGNFPRLILAWLCTEAVRTRSRVIVLGPSLAKFMKTLGIYSSGGGRDQIKLRNQMKRLFGCTVSMIYEDEHGEQFVSSLVAGLRGQRLQEGPEPLPEGSRPGTSLGSLRLQYTSLDLSSPIQ